MKIVFKRHRSIRSLVMEYVRATRIPVKHLRITFNDGTTMDFRQLCAVYAALGYWGFAKVRARPRQVHYWAKHGTPRRSLALVVLPPESTSGSSPSVPAQGPSPPG